MIWFTSDTHFGHDGIRRHCARPFADCDEMNAAMIDNWNALVQKGDSVYHLGDFAFGSVDSAREIADALTGQIFLIKGNHDRIVKSPKIRDRFVWIKDLARIKPVVDGEKKYIVLCHYAMRVWNRKHHGAWHLYGHSHGSLSGVGRSLDVGVDTWNYRPVSLEAVARRMASLENNEADYHDRLQAV